MNVLIAAGSEGGSGVASDGTTHAKTMLREINQLISLTLRVDIFPLTHPAPSLKRIEIRYRLIGLFFDGITFIIFQRSSKYRDSIMGLPPPRSSHGGLPWWEQWHQRSLRIDRRVSFQAVRRALRRSLECRSRT